jgi:ethanolamine transporter EutH
VGADLKQWKLRVSGNSAFLAVISAGMLLGAALAFTKTDSSSRLDYAVVGGILGGLFSAMLAIPLVIKLVVTPKTKRLLREIEQFAKDQLARRDPVGSERSVKEVE